MKPPKVYLLLIGQVIAGLLILILFQSIKWKIDTSLDVLSMLMLIAFVLLNIATACSFRIVPELKVYWSLRKAFFLIPAFLFGLLIASLPVLLYTLLSRSSLPVFNTSLSPFVIINTFFIVGWEELWFRGIVLNYCTRYLSRINIAFTIGLLFALVHCLNPEIDLLKQWPALFFAGTFLALVYFYYRNIWVPVGLHLGNNLFSTLIKGAEINDSFFGPDGYLSTIILFLLCIYFAFRLRTGLSTDMMQKLRL
jgi:membrane protease YdiL (CAAX protease family)